MRTLVALLLFMLPCTSLVGQTRITAPTAAKQYDVLGGLNSFDVHLAITVPEIDTSAVRNKIELKLRQNSIPVSKAAVPSLWFECLGELGDLKAIVTYTCRLSVVQFVLRTYPSDLGVSATTWESAQTLYSVGLGRFNAGFYDTLDKLTDNFLNDWYKANPKKE